jgi:hypothetical protein
MIRQDSNLVPSPDHDPSDLLEALAERLARIEAALDQLRTQRTIKDFYTTDEVAELLGKAPFTVREYCRLGRVKAQKRVCGRGRSKEWVISHEELLRLRNHGLLPIPHPYRHLR